MYVAITRAKTELYITRAHERYTFGNYSANPKSRFIKEIPAEYLEVESDRGSAQSIFGGGANGFSSLGNMFGTTSQESNSTKPAGNWTPFGNKSAAGTGNKKHSAADFSSGQRIKHAQYGIGTIISIRDAIADIAFSGLGIKKMNVEIAPIEKI